MHHATIAEAGACPECRAWAIGLHQDGPYAYLLTFPLAGDASPPISLIRDWQPIAEDASETAWATGCNLSRGVVIEEIPVRVAVESGIEMFRVHEGAEAKDALRAIDALRPPPAGRGAA